MGNDANSIHEKSTKQHVKQPKSFKSNLANLPEITETDQEYVLYGSGTKKSRPINIYNHKICYSLNSCATDSGKDDFEKFGKATPTMESFITISSFEDSSSMIPIDRNAKNCKLIAPRNSPQHNYLKIPREFTANREGTLDRSIVIDLWEYSTNRRSQISSESSIAHYKDDIVSGDFSDCTKTGGRYSFEESANYRTNSNYFDVHDGGRMSTGTTLSELSLPGRQLNISFSRSDARRPSDSIAIAWPQGAPIPETSVQDRNCLTCGTYRNNESGLPKADYKQKSQRVGKTAKNLARSSLFGVRPVNNKFSRPKTQEGPEWAPAESQAHLSMKVILAD